MDFFIRYKYSSQHRQFDREMSAHLKEFLNFLLYLCAFTLYLCLLIANVFLSSTLFEQLIFLGMQSYLAGGLSCLFGFFISILISLALANMWNLLDSILNPGTQSSQDSSSSSPLSCSTPLDSPPPYCLVMEGEMGDLPTYEEATK